MTKALKLDVFSDPACPWCLLGLKRLDAALDRLPDDVTVNVVHHPFFLDPNASEEGEDVVEMLKQKYGRAPDEAWDRLESEAAKSGFVLDMRKQKWRYATQSAQMLIQAAAEKGNQQAVAVAMSDAYYLDAKNIADHAVLTEVGVANGFTADEVAAILADDALRQSVEAEAAVAPAQGVNGVPFFVFQEKYALSGAQPDEVFDRAFAMLLSEEASEVAG